MPRAYRRADAVVTVSRHAAAELARHAGLDPGRVEIVPYGADRLPIVERTPSTKRMLLIVGSLAHYKRLDVAVEALAALRRDGDDYELVLAGGAWPGCAEAVDDVAAELGVAEHVIRLGNVDGERLATLFAEAHALVALSSCESFGIPVVEAMRAGVPVVVADEPWSAETVGEAAIRVDGKSPEAVAEGVRQLSDSDEWQYRSESGAIAAGRYSWAGNAQGITQVVQSVLLSPDRARA
jgi:glycosyltransferase involved in cell wall biosynthesis